MKKIKAGRKMFFAIFIVYCVLATAIVLGQASIYPDAYPAYENESVAFTEGWIVYEDGEQVGIDATLPFNQVDKDCETIDLYNTLPETGYEHTLLTTTVFQRKVKIFVDDQLIFEDQYQPRGARSETPGSGRFSIPLPIGFEGKDIHIQYEKMVEDNSSTAVVDLASSYINPHLSVRNGGMLFILNIVLLTLGGLLFVLTLLFRGIKIDVSSVMFLAAFIVTATVWAMCNSKAMQFFTGNLVVIHNLEYISFYLIPVFAWGFLTLNQKRETKTAKRMLVVVTFFFGLTVTSKLFGIWDFYHFLIIFHGLLLISLIVFVKTSVNAFRSRNLPAMLFYIGFFTLALGGIVDFILFYFLGSAKPMAIFFIGGVLVLGLCIVVIFMIAVRDALTEQISNDVYKKMAYTDTLTQLGNRRMFEEDLEGLEASEKTILISLDVDYFKEVNDNYGHAAGDEVLKIVARELHRAFKDKGKAYRIGGDEFIVIVKEGDMEDLELLFKEMDKCLLNYKACHVSISHGMVCWDKEQYRNIQEALEVSDGIMYQNKRKIRFNDAGKNDII